MIKNSQIVTIYCRKRPQLERTRLRAAASEPKDNLTHNHQFQWHEYTQEMEKDL